MKSPKKQKRPYSSINIIYVALVLLIAAAAIYAYNTFKNNSDTIEDVTYISETLPAETDINGLKRRIAVTHEIAYLS